MTPEPQAQPTQPNTSGQPTDPVASLPPVEATPVAQQAPVTAVEATFLRRCFLGLSNNGSGRWQFKQQEWKGATITFTNKQVVEGVSLAGGRGSQLPANAHTITILPETFIGKTRDELILLGVPTEAMMDYRNGNVTPLPTSDPQVARV